MGDNSNNNNKKPAPPLGSIRSQYVAFGGRPPPGVGDRLESLNPSRDTAMPQPAPRKFTPNIVPRVKKEPTKGDDIDSKLKGPMASLLDESTFQQGRLAAKFRPKQPAGRGVDSKTGIAGKSPFAGGLGAAGPFKRKDGGGGDSDMADSSSSSKPIKKYDLEIDSSNPNHPSVLPFVDPQRERELALLRAKDKEDDFIMAGIKNEIAKLDKEEEKATPEALVSTLDIPTPLMVEGELLNEDNLFFIQLPSSLPFIPPPPENGTTTNTTTQPTNAQTTPTPHTNAPHGGPPGQRPQKNEYVNSLRGVNGHLGKIVIYKSGKVKLRIGDYLYDITAANNPNFLEELMVLDGSSCYRVGPMSQHLIVTPDIDDLLQKESETLGKK